MDYQINKLRIEALRRELQKIGAQNRVYFSHRQRLSDLERVAHERRRVRVVEINAELASMLKGK